MAAMKRAPEPIVRTSDEAYWKMRVLAGPGFLLVAWLFAKTSWGQWIQILFSGMWLHEAGHALTSWFCGIFAIILPWYTFHPTGERSSFVMFVFAAGLGFWLYVARHHWPYILAFGLLFIGGLLLPMKKVHPLILFNGDAGSMVFGALLMASLYLPREHAISKRHLGWGFVFLGAMSFSVVFNEWKNLPFDRIGTSDSRRFLAAKPLWLEIDLINAYQLVGWLSLAAFAGAWAWGLYCWRREAST